MNDCVCCGNTIKLNTRREYSGGLKAVLHGIWILKFWLAKGKDTHSSISSNIVFVVAVDWLPWYSCCTRMVCVVFKKTGSKWLKTKIQKQQKAECVDGSSSTKKIKINNIHSSTTLQCPWMTLLCAQQTAQNRIELKNAKTIILQNKKNIQQFDFILYGILQHLYGGRLRQDYSQTVDDNITK